ncbi:ferrichrome-iron receptor [Calothrix sp. PCC 7716]|nr:ferrichrome-iron receptor [Calothrix sp. PCC 7716]
MKRWWLLGNFNLSLVISIFGCLSAIGIQPGLAEEKSGTGHKISPVITSEIPQLSEIELPAKSATMLGQAPAPTNPLNPDSSTQGEKQGGIVTITGVKANPTEKGVEVILETTQGDKLQVTNRSANNNFIADITGGQLRLPSGDAFTFKSENPISGITQITVTNVDANTVRVTVVGEKTLPTVELFDDNAGLIFAVVNASVATQPPEVAPTQEKPASEAPQEKPFSQQDGPIELVVTGEQDGYRAPNASTATRTDTPIRDIPQSIQVVPQEVLRDRNVRTVNEAVETVSGVLDGGDSIFRIFRGFSTTETSQLRNGYRLGSSYLTVPEEPTVAIEQVEVLKGPGSVLFGALEPGGIINTITKKPKREPYYKLGLEVGNYGFYQPSIDLSGPLTADKKVLYRFIAAYNGADGYFNGGGKNNTLISPSITLNLGDRTSLDLYYEFSRYAGDLYGNTFTVARSDGSLVPRGVNVWGNPDLTFDERQNHQYGFALKHDFNNNLQIRGAFSAKNFSVPGQRFAVPIAVVDDRFVEFFYLDRTDSTDVYFGQIDLLSKFKTGSIEHQLLLGFDYEDNSQAFKSFTSPIPPLDLLNPTYNVARPTDLVQDFMYERLTQSYGVYFQDQIAFSNNLKLLIGGRYDWVSNELELVLNDTDEPAVNDGAFSPRVGLVYQPSDTISLYASYSRSFLQTTSFSPGQVFKPTRGTQYEVGIKTDFLEKKLSATLAAYHLTKTNVVTSDPVNPFLSVQTGEQRSQGIELDVAGEILPGWRVIASYAYTDAEVTKDNSISVGNQLNNVPTNQASLWTTYEIQQGNLKGLGFGLGLFYVGERQGDLANTFTLSNYLRTDAALYYRWEGLRAAINIRNLFDTDYASFANSSTYVQRGAPFTITGSVSWEF